MLGSILSNDGNSVFYIMAVPFILMGASFAGLRLIARGSIRVGVLLFFLLVGGFLFFYPVEKANLYIRIFTVEMLLLVYFFSEIKIDLSRFTKFLNTTYVFYFLFSVAIWSGVLPANTSIEKNTFLINVGGFNFETLYGLGGSTADIDSYSGLVLIWNVFVNKVKRSSYGMIALSSLAMLMTFRMTPIVALVLSFLIYFVVVNRVLAFLAIILPALGFVSALLALNYSPTFIVPFVGHNMDWYTLMWKATHARSSIWLGQIHYFINEFTFSDYIFGSLDERMTVDFVDGDGRVHKDSYNPHNTYLSLLFRSSLFFSLFYILFVAAVARRSRKVTFPVVFYISIVAYTNASVLGLQNPMYLLVLLYVLFGMPREKFNARLE